MDELTGGRGIVFATGTPVSNSMTELYTVMRYLQYSTLQKKNLTHFDSWASTFGETTTAIELAPEEANQVGYEFAMRFTKGNHAFIVATHIDANSHFLRTAGPHFPDSPGHIKRTAWDISRAEGTPPH